MAEEKKSKSKTNEVFAEELVNGLESTTILIQSLLEDIKENSEIIGALKSEMEDMGSQLKLMEEIIRGGSSNQSLLTRFALLERDVQDILKDLEQKQFLQTIQSDSKNKEKSEKIKFLIGGIVSLISAIIAAVATYYSK